MIDILENLALLQKLWHYELLKRAQHISEIFANILILIFVRTHLPKEALFAQFLLVVDELLGSLKELDDAVDFFELVGLKLYPLLFDLHLVEDLLEPLDGLSLLLKLRVDDVFRALL